MPPTSASPSKRRSNARSAASCCPNSGWTVPSGCLSISSSTPMQKSWIHRAHDHFVLGPVSCDGPDAGEAGRYRVGVHSIRCKLTPPIPNLTFSYVLVAQSNEMVANRDLGLFTWQYGAPLDCKTVPPQLRARGLGQRRISTKKCYFRSLDDGIPAHSDLSLSVHGCVGFAVGAAPDGRRRFAPYRPLWDRQLAKRW